MGEFGQTTIKTVPEVPVLALCAKSNTYGDSFSELFTKYLFYLLLITILAFHHDITSH